MFKPSLKQHDFQLLRNIAVIIIALMVAASVVVGYFKYSTYDTTLHVRSAEILKSKGALLDAMLDELRRDLQLIKEETKRVLSQEASDPDALLVDLYCNVVEAHQDYLQLRLLDLSGKERIRIDRQGDDVQAAKELQDKSQRYYFTNATALLENEVYLSALDLNIEHQEIVLPYQPVIRLVEPLFVNGVRVGYLVLNYDAREMIRQLETNEPPIQMILLNEASYYLAGVDQQQSFGWMFDTKKELRFSREQPEVWEQMQLAKQGAVSHDGLDIHYLAYDPVAVLSPDRSLASSRTWYILTSHSAEEAWEEVLAQARDDLPLIILLILLGVAVILLLYLLILTNRQKEQELLYETRMASIGETISMIAHQWRQPLTVISTSSMNMSMDLELGGIDPEQLKKQIDRIEQTTQMLSKTIDDFRYFYQASPKKSSSNLHDLIVKSINIIEALYLSNYQIVFDCRLQDEPITLMTKESKLVQVLLQLYANAKDALIERQVSDPKIVISATQDRHNVFISVEDNGGGISEAIMGRIFEPYFSTKGLNGHGTGLHTVKLIVTRHLDGTIKVENTEAGAKFTLAFPRVRAEEPTS